MRYFAFLLVVLLSLPPVRAAESGDRPFILVLNAFPPELNATLKQLNLDPAASALPRPKGIPMFKGQVDGKDVVVVQTGMSMVNAAMSLQIALDRFPATHVLFAGIAGGIDPALHIGDVVIPEKWAYHAEASYFNSDGKGGYVPSPYFTSRYPKLKYANHGMIFPDEVQAIKDGQEHFAYIASFPADPGLLQVARRAVAALGELKAADDGRLLKVEIGGTGVTGPVFMDNADYRKHVMAVWKARCIDMESTAYAHVCHTNGVPFLAIRSLSDLAGGQEGENPELAHRELSSEIAVRVLRAIIKEL